MDINLKRVKQDDINSLVVDSNTSDPIAVISRVGKSYDKNKVRVAWHPAFLKMNPSVGNSILHSNFDVEKSASDAMSSIHNRYNTVLLNHEVKDPVKTTFMGTQEIINHTNNSVQKHDVYHVHNDEGVAFAKIIANPNTRKEMGTGSFSDRTSLHILPEYKSSFPDAVVEASKKKFSGSSMSHSLNAARYLLDNQHKQPRFIGDVYGNGAVVTFKTHLSPEQASNDYEEHMKSNNPSLTITRHSPTMFTAKENPEYEGDKHKLDTIMAVPGQVIHSSSDYHDTSYSHKQKHSTIIEQKE